MAPRTCLGCGRATSGASRCDDCRRAHDRERRPSTTQRGLGAAWRATVAEVLVRDSYTCRLRLRGCTVLATTGDHVIPRSMGGTDDPENVVAACAHCNYAKGARTVPILEVAP